MAELARLLGDSWPVWAAAGTVLIVLSLLVWAMARGSADRDYGSFVIEGAREAASRDVAADVAGVALPQGPATTPAGAFEYADECGGPDVMRSPLTGRTIEEIEQEMDAFALGMKLRATAHAAGAAMHARRMSRCDSIDLDAAYRRQLRALSGEFIGVRVTAEPCA